MEGCPLKGLYGDIRPRAVKTEEPKENEMETAAARGFRVKGLVGNGGLEKTIETTTFWAIR